MNYATFNADGDCLTISSHPPGVEVPRGLQPAEIWQDEDGDVVMRQPAEIDLPATIDIGETLLVEVPARCRLFADGEPVNGTALSWGSAGDHLIELRGACIFRAVLRVVDYAAARADEYPSLADQLDAIWKGGADMEQMRDRIMGVKALYPKP